MSVSNGQVSYNRGEVNGGYSIGTQVTYSYNNGHYKSSGWSVRTCQQSGSWNGYPAVCSQGNDFFSFLNGLHLNIVS